MIRTTIKLLMWTILVFPFFSSPVLAQATEVCKAGSGLAWDMSAAEDAKEYTVYIGEAAGVERGGATVVEIVIPHDPANAVDNGDGTRSVQHVLILTRDGDHFFKVDAVDSAGNRSDTSNEISCNVNMKAPDTPTLRLIFITPADTE